MDHDVTGFVTDIWATGSNVVLSFSMSSELLKHTVKVFRLLKAFFKELSKVDPPIVYLSKCLIMLGVPTQPDHVYNTNTFAVIESTGIN